MAPLAHYSHRGILFSLLIFQNVFDKAEQPWRKKRGKFTLFTHLGIPHDLSEWNAAV